MGDVTVVVGVASDASVLLEVVVGIMVGVMVVQALVKVVVLGKVFLLASMGLQRAQHRWYMFL